MIALDRDQSDLATFARRAPSAATLSKEQITAQEPYLAERYSKALFLVGKSSVR